MLLKQQGFSHFQVGYVHDKILVLNETFLVH